MEKAHGEEEGEEGRLPAYLELGQATPQGLRPCCRSQRLLSMETQAVSCAQDHHSWRHYSHLQEGETPP